MIQKSEINKPIQRQTIDPKILAAYRQPIEQALSVFKKAAQAFLTALAIKDPSRVLIKIDENNKIPLTQLAAQAVKKHDPDLLLLAAAAINRACDKKNINEKHQVVYENNRRLKNDANAETLPIEIALSSSPEAKQNTSNNAIYAGTVATAQTMQNNGKVGDVEVSASSKSAEDSTAMKVYSNKAYTIMLSGIKGSKDYFEV